VTSPRDTQLTGMAGEFLVVGQLFKRELQASITLGNAKSVDVLAYNPRTDRQFAISVKSLRRRNCFRLDPASVRREHIYVFVLLNAPIAREQYFIVSGSEILNDMSGFFGASLKYESQQAVNMGPLRPYAGNWALFESPMP
jgi:hypothetical protein